MQLMFALIICANMKRKNLAIVKSVKAKVDWLVFNNVLNTVDRAAYEYVPLNVYREIDNSTGLNITPVFSMRFFNAIIDEINKKYDE